ncbi:MAG TPA: hypothetical protein VHJ20_03120 [Polyangia bacterium]|nr:hypothetical protein [Polyangia bacterium]
MSSSNARWTALCFAVTGIIAASCGDQAGNYVPTGGGTGVVLPGSGGGTGGTSNLDAGADDAKVDRIDVAAGGGGGHAGSSGGTGGHGAGGNGGATATGGGTGAGGATSTGGTNGTGGASSTGGAGGSAPQDDPCTACERAKCSHPSGITSVGDPYSLAFGAYAICFLGTGFPVDQGGMPCSDPNLLGPNASGGPAQGMPKSTLCRALMDCVHKSHCDDIGCYCGEGVNVMSCESGAVPATGACKAEVENATESTQISGDSGIAGQYYNRCLATASALELLGGCDVNCCAQECLGVPNDTDKGYCNAASSTDGSGGGGTTGHTGGSTGQTGGSTGQTGGTGGHGGTGGSGGSSSTSTGGATGTGGSSSTGGITGSGGTGGVAGGGGTGGSSSTGGSSGGGGSTNPDAGAGGSGGAPGATLANVHFDTTVDPWLPVFVSTIARSTEDANGSPTSGALDVSIANGSGSISLEGDGWQCITATAGATYRLSAKVRIPGQTSSVASVGFWYYASSDCSGAIVDSFDTPTSSDATWKTVTGSPVVPTGIGSMRVRLTVRKPIGQTAAEALFDDVVAERQ